MSRSVLAILAVVAVIAVGVGGYLAYDTFLRGDSTPALTLPSASPEATTDPTTEPSASADAGASDAPASTDPGTGTDGDVAGTWTITEALAGYRVREQLANLPAESDAVGRTSDVTGSITLDGSGDAVQLTGGTIDVDTTTITSDEGMRDNRMRTQGLQTESFPTASFTITQPVDVPTAALSGTASGLTLVGDLTLHGVTKSVEIPAQAQLVDGVVQVAGSLTFPLSDFDIVAPNVGGFIVSIADDGTLEFAASFAKG
jgi:polyisoprenoid-binding protein YceI